MLTFNFGIRREAFWVAWERLKTDYKDAVWSGLRKFIPIDNGDGSYSVKKM